MKNQAVRTLSLFLVTVALYLFLWRVLEIFFVLSEDFYGRLIELLALVLFAVLAATTPMEFAKMGILVPKRVLFRSLASGALLGALGIGIFAATRGVIGGEGVFFTPSPLWDPSRAIYVLVAPFQEVLAKSVMLYSFERVFDESHPLYANLLSALFFGVFHICYGPRLMLLSMLLCFVTGILFQRVRCVWGCAVAHFLLGFFPACFGLPL